MSRSRLDEIIEEEHARKIYPMPSDLSLTDGLKDFGKRIAERAFRHGVERAAKNLFKYPEAVNVDRVQPAPAEEKPGVHWMAEKPEDGRVYEWKYMGGPLITNDRRRGQRRTGKHCECWCNRPFWHEQLSPSDKITLAHGDARSGQERRKQ